MKKFIFFFIFYLIIVLNIAGQITEGNWMFGGSGNIPMLTNNSYSRRFRLNPDIGYFLVDKVAVVGF